jgi:formylglycine-generating enzyme required for sulfatase activity
LKHGIIGAGALVLAGCIVFAALEVFKMNKPEQQTRVASTPQPAEEPGANDGTSQPATDNPSKPPAPKVPPKPVPAPTPEPGPAPTPQPEPAPKPATDVPAGFKAVEAEGRDETGLWKEVEHVKSGIRLRLIPAGEFDMGSNDADREKPVHHVKISKPFYMGKCEVTQGQWKAVMGADKNPSKSQGDDLPAEHVSWNDAQGFLKNAGDGLRLSTEAEWEYACRAGSAGRWCFGDEEGKLGEYAWYKDNAENKTHSAGQKKPNAWGLFDMHGNVSEWCSDWYDVKYYEASKDAADPRGPDAGQYRAVRGGSWRSVAGDARSAYRGKFAPDTRDGEIGFRVAVFAMAGS